MMPKLINQSSTLHGVQTHIFFNNVCDTTLNWCTPTSTTCRCQGWNVTRLLHACPVAGLCPPATNGKHADTATLFALGNRVKELQCTHTHQGCDKARKCGLGIRHMTQRPGTSLYHHSPTLQTTTGFNSTHPLTMTKPHTLLQPVASCRLCVLGFGVWSFRGSGCSACGQGRSSLPLGLAALLGLRQASVGQP